MKASFRFLSAMFALSVLLLCCNKDESGSGGNSSGSGSGSSSGSSSSSYSDSAVNPDPVTESECSSSTEIDEIICLANAFKAQLTSAQLASVQLDYSTANAKRWSNFPEAIYKNRIGLSFGSMTQTQIAYAKALLKAVSGTQTNEGWDELQQLLNADQYLNANGGGNDYGAANYYIAFLGTPATSGTFEIYYGGHHTAFSNTYKNGALAGATPSFRGVEPFATFTWHNKDNQPIQQEQATLSAMLTALSSTELATAKLSGTYSDLVAGPQNDDNIPNTPSGIACSNLTSAQKTLVMNAIKTYVDDVADSASFISKYTGGLDNTYIAYSGTTGMTTKNDYVRIDGPGVWIEYSCQNGVILSGTHPHSVWRDKQTDYGGN